MAPQISQSQVIDTHSYSTPKNCSIGGLLFVDLKIPPQRTGVNLISQLYFSGKSLYSNQNKHWAGKIKIKI